MPQLANIPDSARWAETLFFSGDFKYKSISFPTVQLACLDSCPLFYPKKLGDHKISTPQPGSCPRIAH